MQKSLISLSIALSVVLFTSSCGDSSTTEYSLDSNLSTDTTKSKINNETIDSKDSNLEEEQSISESSNEAITGTGYYVDSAVDGVSYICGLSSGTTDEDGKFIFEEGKDCSFSVAGVTLRTTKAKDLRDGQKIVEDSFEVARFLQSIDNDGNPDNGIQINSETIDAVLKALEENDSKAKLPTDTKLEAVITSVENDVELFKGRVKTEEEVKSHLNNTKTDITKNILIGKTLYTNDNTLNFNEDGSFTVTDKDGIEDTISYSIDGDLICNEDGCSKLISYSEDSAIFEEDDGDIFTLYYTRAKAKENFNIYTSSSSKISENPTSILELNNSNDEITEYYYDKNGNVVSTCTYSQYSASCESFTELLDTYYDKNGNIVEMYLECDEKEDIELEVEDNLITQENFIAEEDLLEITELLVEPESELNENNISVVDGYVDIDKEAIKECEAFNDLKHTTNQDDIKLIIGYEYNIIEGRDNQFRILIDYISQGDIRHRWVNKDCFY